MGDRGDLRFLAPPLVKLGYSVAALDLPYHGESESEVLSCSDTARLLSETLLTVLQHHGHKPPSITLVGYSLGGRIAFEVTTLAQAGLIGSIHVEALVLISSAPPPNDEAERSNCTISSNARYEKLLDSNFSPEKYEDWLRNSWYAAELWGNIRDKPFFQDLISEKVLVFNERRRTQWALAAKNMCRSTMTSISEPLECPVLYFYGTCDRKYAAMAVELQKVCSNFRSLPIEGAGHNIHLDSPSLLAFHVETFLHSRIHTVVESVVELLKVKFVRYSIPLKQAFEVGGHEIKERKGIVVALVATNHCVGVGDICPLPGLHHEDIDHCVKEVRDLSSRLQALRRPYNVMSNQAILEFLEFVQNYSLVSRNGFEAAFVHLHSLVLHQPISDSLRLCASSLLYGKNLTASEFIDMNGVLPRIPKSSARSDECSPESLYRESIQMSPFEVMKLKVGASDDMEEELRAVRTAVLVAKSSGKRIRLDANRAWSISQYEQFENGLKEYVEWIEYIEEPFSTPEQLSQFIAAQHEQSCGLPLALDESLNDCSFDCIQHLASSDICQTLVLKPAVIGSLRHLFQLVSIAEKHRCEIVFSTVFESGVGTAWTSILASVLGSRGQHHGVGTFKHLVNDVTELSFGEAAVKGNCRIWMDPCERFLSQAASSLFSS
ncbi:Alpha/beta hydrolase [Gracilaria domingensis]|nr:Alpha/beta hydrolase [Gracilaria domingensis]